MTAIVKHISVHPNFRYVRRTGIFDDLDTKSCLDRHRSNKQRARQKVLRNAENFDFNKKSEFVTPAFVYYKKKSEVDQQFPAQHPLHGFDLERMLEIELGKSDAFIQRDPDKE
ncbi:hypothetical protein YOLOSWAG_211 [Erwinia phage vB_EamM_Yoloswag]|uniref:Uncharacterized protein n=1 Tax=Erwinia phage vB_EamM_Yoloswag TaxID=1958956 RepID=A0A1S6L3F8_9CAUD|nr:hypothetical protein HOR66_gp211 [Erwinia phage vB_EamM_Yoloswag]AQT28689.1 hypothetical protein YOLOSWAG_211 [Erwinia phage vB_EamM_Yoloswag]